MSPRRGRRSTHDVDVGITMDQALEEYDIGNQVQRELEGKGIVLPERPKIRGKDYDGTLPPNLMEISDFDVGELLTKTTEWAEYISGCLAWMEAAEIEAKDRVETVKAFIRKRLLEERERMKEKGEAISSDDKKYKDDDEVRTNPQFVEENANYLRYQCLKIITKRAYEAAEKNRVAVSNAIRLREESGKREGRRASATGRRRGGGSFPRTKP